MLSDINSNGTNIVLSGLNTNVLLTYPRAGELGILPALPKFYLPYQTDDLTTSCVPTKFVPAWRAGEFHDVPALTSVLPVWTGRETCL